jgi:hypothetical protein
MNLTNKLPIVRPKITSPIREPPKYCTISTVPMIVFIGALIFEIQKRSHQTYLPSDKSGQLNEEE